MKKTTSIILGATAIVAVSAGVAGLTAYSMMPEEQNKTLAFEEVFQVNPNTRLAAFDAMQMQPVDLTKAAESSVNAVVHIKSTQESKTQTVTVRDPFYEFFGDMFGNRGRQQRQVETPERVGFGSGVIISSDGYIVTNNHVIDKADVISVKLNDGREFQGRIIGTDPSTDLALVKIEGEDLPTIPVGDSDLLKIGEWVLAVGNPFNMTSTVTAGIVSAKARSLGVYNKGVESFIQTDAAINPGNSGGPLCNACGQVIGINSAKIADADYEGMGFAIPSRTVKDVVDDLIMQGFVSGRVKIGIIGTAITDFEAQYNKVPRGILISEIVEGGPCDNGKIRTDDILCKLDDYDIKSFNDIFTALTNYKKGDEVVLKLYRPSSEDYYEVRVTLQADDGSTTAE